MKVVAELGKGRVLQGKGILLKLTSEAQEHMAAASLSLDGVKLELTPLFEVSAGSRGAAAAASIARRHYWVKATLLDDIGGSSSAALWDIAYRFGGQMNSQFGLAMGQDVLAVEPDLEQSWLQEAEADLSGPALSAARKCRPSSQSSEKGAVGPEFAWHLGNDFTGLAAARTKARNARGIKIAHLDTGYDPDHQTLPENIDTNNAWNFIDEDHPNNAVDRTPDGGVLRNRGHGTGTLGILAGAKLDGIMPPEANTGKYLGGAPLATIYPMRIANSVVHFWTSSVAQAIAKASELNVDILSMSMGGVASEAWADAVNVAYDSGVVLVCAAGNNYDGFPTSKLVYPAYFHRVIAACGVMADGSQYHELPGFKMEGNAGPTSRMGSAVAAYTPNIPWAKIGCSDVLDLDGAGTSSATPQIAAASALWLAKHGENYSRDWRRVEAVRKAIFKSASLKSGGLSKDQIKEYFGQGVLRAVSALDQAPDKLGRLVRTRPEGASFSFLRVLFGLGFKKANIEAQRYALELTQLAQGMPSFADIIPNPDATTEPVTKAQRTRFFEQVLDEGRCSRTLSQYLERHLGDGSGGKAGKYEKGLPKHVYGKTITRRDIPAPPTMRRLRVFALDPSIATSLDTKALSEVTIEIPWEGGENSENELRPGPIGEYIEVVDVDPASGLVYAPIDLNNSYLLAQDGLAPSEGSPQFHQQMVYAVVMKTIKHFERALGRTALWKARRVKVENSKFKEEIYTQRLRIYPHALRQSNAFYSPRKAALLFGYFPASQSSPDDSLSGGMVFTCLSHDIIAHETAHALLDGLHRRYKDDTNSDSLAFHEAFADIVAIFQHFTYPEILRHAIGRTQGDLEIGTMLNELARQFGKAMGYSDALRSALGPRAEKINYATATEPHDKGAVLVAAVFRAFVSIYNNRTADLIRIATGGSGVLEPGALHPDLVGRLAEEATKAAGHVLTICIRALDYCPPVDIDFPDYLRAMITADYDAVEEDVFGYRTAFLEAFRHFNIYPHDVRTISVESLRWSPPEIDTPFQNVWRAVKFSLDWDTTTNRRKAYKESRKNARKIHKDLAALFEHRKETASELGLDMNFNGENTKFEVHSVRPARRVSPDGSIKTDIVVVLTQWRHVFLDPKNQELGKFWFRGGCTLIVDPDHKKKPIRYLIIKNINSERRMERERKHRIEHSGQSLRSLYFADSDKEPFAVAHNLC